MTQTSSLTIPIAMVSSVIKKNNNKKTTEVREMHRIVASAGYCEDCTASNVNRTLHRPLLAAAL